MATQVQISSFQNSICNDVAAEEQVKSSPANKLERAANIKQIVAHSLEFVALPGRAEGIQTQIPIAMGHAFGDTQGFVGCLVLVSEQEARLVTVITLWSGSSRSESCSDSSKRLQKWLSPYVDRWLRARTYASFVTAPQQFLANCGFQAEISATSAHLQ